jgi:(E)-4-hydroxy-3-methylbut-2-enyl-diphosphate synthase
LAEEGSDWNYPIHLGVTEAGDGEDARIKSAIGIGSLLRDGVGDTIRVSLTEDSIHEIPVARKLIEATVPYGFLGWPASCKPVQKHDSFSYKRRETETVTVAGVRIGGAEVMKVLTIPYFHDALAHKLEKLGDYQPDGVLERPRNPAGVTEVDPRDDEAIAKINASPEAQLVTVTPLTICDPLTAFRTLAAKLDERHPILLKDDLFPPDDRVPPGEPDFLGYLLGTSAAFGSLICDGIGDAIFLSGWDGPGQLMRVSFNLLQAAGARIFKTDYVACPSCGRTLFNLQETTARIKAATSHLKGVKIAIMGCIVNGPGEMADADFGYVGGAPNKINLYVGKNPVKFNIPQDEAVERLKDLIKEHGKWVEPAGA